MTPNLGSNIRFVLLDHDDTQVGTIKAKWAAHKYVAAKYYGKVLGDDVIRRYWGKPLRELVCLLYGDANVERAMARYMPTSADFPKTVFEGTLAVLEQLKHSGRLTGVVSATTRESLEYDWETLGIDGPRLFDYVQTEEDTDHHKPSPLVFDPAIRWAELRGIGKSQILYVADGLHDLIAATEAGIGFIGVATGLVSLEEFMAKDVKALSRLPELVSA
jgi:phosphoglycolate phosphatase-like HAD superfamily hydrolase